MSGMVRVTIDDRTVEVPAGTLITDAARAAEVHVPIFCSHAKLPPLGACRICVVEVGTPQLGPDRKPVLGPDGRARDRVDAQGPDRLHHAGQRGHARAHRIRRRRSRRARA